MDDLVKTRADALFEGLVTTLNSLIDCGAGFFGGFEMKGGGGGDEGGYRSEEVR